MSASTNGSNGSNGQGEQAMAYAPVKGNEGAERGTTKIKIYRGDAEGGEFVEYETAMIEGMVVLDAVLNIQAEQAPDLAVRWNCKAAHCGSCSAEVNGKPTLMCKQRVNEYEGEVRVQPMQAFPVIRDLVSDVSWNYEVSRSMQPFTTSEQAPFTMYEEDVERLYEPKSCIECFMCQDVCHVLRTHHKHPEFAGPRFFRAGSVDGDAPDGRGRPSQGPQGRPRHRILQHNQVLHRSLPGRHPHHGQLHHPAKRARRRRILRSGQVAHAEAPGPPQRFE